MFHVEQPDRLWLGLKMFHVEHFLVLRTGREYLTRFPGAMTPLVQIL